MLRYGKGSLVFILKFQSFVVKACRTDALASGRGQAETVIGPASLAFIVKRAVKFNFNIETRAPVSY